MFYRLYCFKCDDCGDVIQCDAEDGAIKAAINSGWFLASAYGGGKRHLCQECHSVPVDKKSARGGFIALPSLAQNVIRRELGIAQNKIPTPKQVANGTSPARLLRHPRFGRNSLALVEQWLIRHNATF